MFDWKEEFSVGIDKFDKQHKKLLKIGKELYYSFDNVEANIDQYDKIIELLNEMHDYTVYHFNFEEKVMEKFDYPGLEKQKKSHQQFVEKLEEIDPKEIDLNQKEFSMKLLNFIANWIENHIMGEDQKYTAYLSDKKIG
jgi:hemerythrin